MAKLKVNDFIYTHYGYGTLSYLGENIEITPLWNQPELSEFLPKITYEEFSKTNFLYLKDVNKSLIDQQSSITLQKRITNNKEVNLVKEQFLQKQIVIHVKTFYGERKIFSFIVDINYSIQNLKNKIIENTIDENSKKLMCGLRLIYPMGFVQELANSSSTLEMYKIPNNAQLILFSKLTFAWDPNLKAPTIKLSNNNLTANKQSDDGSTDYQTVLGTLEMNSSKHYWELKIDKYVEEEDILIGVARKDLSLTSLPHETGKFWGYACCCAKLCGPEGEPIEYGQAATTGDSVGILLEFTGGQASLSFYKNGANLGVAYSNLQGSFYSAVSMVYGEIQVTLDPKASIPIS